jgi:hypothetical protein
MSQSNSMSAEPPILAINCGCDRNIDELLKNLHGSSRRVRQSGIDEELFDVISGFEALVGPRQ